MTVRAESERSHNRRSPSTTLASSPAGSWLTRARYLEAGGSTGPWALAVSGRASRVNGTGPATRRGAAASRAAARRGRRFASVPHLDLTAEPIPVPDSTHTFAPIRRLGV